jgi:hypothetical protein
MTPKSFVVLAAVAVLFVVAAVLVYSSSTRWSHAVPNGVALFPDLRGDAAKIAEIDLQQGTSKLTLARKGQDWLLIQHGSFPASPEKVRVFLLSLADAKLVEAKTREKDRYKLLGLEDPTAHDATSRLVQLKDGKGSVLAEVVVGNERTDAFGGGKDGTYIRKPSDDQTWLVSTEIEGGVDLKGWVEPYLFEANANQVKHVSVKLPGEDALEINETAGGTKSVLVNMPDGMKLKYLNALDDIVGAAIAVDFEDVRKQESVPSDQASKVDVELANGLKVSYAIEQKGGADWLSLTAFGDGNAKKAANALTARAKGWEFRITKSAADAMLKKREDVLEKVSS